jgi:putative SOS response-associated peptidase YedK
MCGRYFRQSDKQRIAEAFHLGVLPGEFVLPPADYNVAPTTFQPVVRAKRDTGERELALMRWGLVPYFAKSLNEFKAFSTINARTESLTSKAMWRIPFERHRCLVPADGYYEWKTLDPKTKQPYAFLLKDRSPFAFAGLWDRWKEPTGNTWLESFTIVTTDANEVAATAHDRMPVILDAADHARWLDTSDPTRPPIDLLRPYDAEKMIAYPTNPLVGNVRINSPELLNSA